MIIINSKAGTDVFMSIYYDIRTDTTGNRLCNEKWLFKDTSTQHYSNGEYKPFELRQIFGFLHVFQNGQISIGLVNTKVRQYEEYKLLRNSILLFLLSEMQTY